MPDEFLDCHTLPGGFLVEELPAELVKFNVDVMTQDLRGSIAAGTGVSGADGGGFYGLTRILRPLCADLPRFGRI